jgi:hypothetical protein
MAALCRDAATGNKFTQKPVATPHFSGILIFPFHLVNRRLNRANGSLRIELMRLVAP